MSADRLIRPMTDAECDSVAAVWHRTGVRAYTYLPAWQTLSADKAREIFRDIAGRCDMTVIEHDGAIGGFLAMHGSYVDRLYIDPACQGRGLGLALMDHARRLSPGGLELHTHVENHPARSFYRRLGFVAVRFGTSPAPESAPDVEYHWRP